VAQEPLIVYDRGSAYFVAISQMCQQAGIVPRVEMDLDSVEATKHMVELGMGIAFLPRNGISQELGNGALTVIPIREVDPIYLPTCVLLRQAQHFSPMVLAFLKLLQEIYGADVPLLREVGSR
ncbi:MAG: LysR family transcriptional regulator substrate-binding protein, partial [Dehalococcoidia bacterium]